MDNTSTTPIEIQTARISLGLCPTCGIQTQQHNDKGILVPVTNMAVRNSRCLLCNPLSELERIQLINDKLPENNVDYTNLPVGISSSEEREQEIVTTNLRGILKGETYRHKKNSQRSLQSSDQKRLVGGLDKKLQGTYLRMGSFATHSTHHTLVSTSTVNSEFAASVLTCNSESTVTKRTSISDSDDEGSMIEEFPSTSEMTHMKSPADEIFQEGWDSLMGDNHESLDKLKGESLIIRAKDEGSIIAKGFCLFRGWGGLDKNYVEAFEIFSKGALNKDVICFAMTGYFYRNGYGVNKNPHEGIRWLKMATDMGHAWAMSMMGFCYQEGDGVEQDEKKAIELYYRAAKKGYCKAQYNLGELYSCGEGVEADQNASLKWLIKAAQQNHSKAKEKLGWNSRKDQSRRSGSLVHGYASHNSNMSNSDRSKDRSGRIYSRSNSRRSSGNGSISSAHSGDRSFKSSGMSKSSGNSRRSGGNGSMGSVRSGDHNGSSRSRGQGIATNSPVNSGLSKVKRLIARRSSA